MDSLKKEIAEGSGIMEGVEIAIFNGKNQILLGRRLASAGFKTWNFPGGHLKSNETIKNCALREIREELGNAVKIELTNEIISVRENCLAPHYKHHLTIIVKGVFESGEIKVNEPDKCEKWDWFDLDNFPLPLFSGVEEAIKNYKRGKTCVVSDW